MATTTSKEKIANHTIEPLQHNLIPQDPAVLQYLLALAMKKANLNSVTELLNGDAPSPVQKHTNHTLRRRSKSMYAAKLTEADLSVNCLAFSVNETYPSKDSGKH